MSGAPLFLMLAAILAALSHAPAALSAEPAVKPLGMLFYSPAQRTTIAQARHKIDAADTADTNETAVEAAPAPILEVNGLVKRGNGKSTVWINRKPIPEGQPIGARTAPRITASSVVIDGKPVRVGETINLATGQRSDFTPAETVRVKRAQ